MKSATFKIETKADKEDAERLMQLMGYPIIMIDFTTDLLTGKEFLGVYTVGVPKDQSIHEIGTKLYLTINETERLKALKSVYKTLKEGIYPNYDVMFNIDKYKV